MEGIGTYLAVNNALAMVKHLQTLGSAYGEIQKVLQ